MDELYDQYKKIKVLEPKTPSFAQWRMDVGLAAWEKARFENKRTKKNTGGFVNKPMNVGRRSNDPNPSSIKREKYLLEKEQKQSEKKRLLIAKATETARKNLDKQIASIEANALKWP